jgi:threonylcarbamoyladenosine tRNA methylthiotransferase MtaB
VLGEVRRRVAQGHREIVLTGINLGCYRDRDAGYALPRLVREVGEIDGLERLRLSSIEINHVDAALIAALRETPTVSPHLHVPLQSGDDGVLRDVPAPARAARGLQPDDGRDRRLSDGIGACF